MDTSSSSCWNFPRFLTVRARNSWMRALLSALLLTGAVAMAHAQADYPNRPVRIVVPSEPGGGTDISARILAERLSQAMGQQFVVENRPGAGQMIGTEQVAR